MYQIDSEDEVGLPQNGINMIIKETLPDVRVSIEARELANSVCVEFIKMLSREAQKHVSTDQRKTICHDHVTTALKTLNFGEDYVELADSVLGACKQVAQVKKSRRMNSRLDKCGMSEDELYALQQGLIEKARAEQAAVSAEAAARVPTHVEGTLSTSIADCLSSTPMGTQEDFD